jgi:hypothetical protein
MATTGQGIRWRRVVVAVVAVLVLGAAVYAIASMAGFSLAPYPRIVGQNCGAVNSGDSTVSYDPDEAEQCLWQAYTVCQTATLVFTSHGVDIGVVHVVSVQRINGGCAVTDAAQGYSDNGGGSRSRVTTYQCRLRRGGRCLHAATATGAGGPRLRHHQRRDPRLLPIRGARPRQREQFRGRRGVLLAGVRRRVPARGDADLYHQ